jgi:hypothetical protein
MVYPYYRMKVCLNNLAVRCDGCTNDKERPVSPITLLPVSHCGL